MSKNLRTSIPAPLLIAVLLLLSVILLAEIGQAQGNTIPSHQTGQLLSLPSDPNLASLTLQQNAQNVELVTQLGGPVLAVAATGSYAYIGMGPRLAILDVSNPTLVGQTDVLPGIVQSVAVAGEYAYVIGNEYHARLWIVHVANPAHPTAVNSIDFQADVRGITISGNRAYITVAGRGLQILDISNPELPQPLGQFPESGAHVAVAGNYAHTIGSYLYIIDVSDPLSPTQVGTYTLPIGTQVFGHTADGRYVYIAEGNKGLRIVDVSTPNAPALRSQYQPLYEEIQGIAVAGEYVSTGGDNFRVFRQSLYTPTRVSTYDLGQGDALRDRTTLMFPSGAFTDTVVLTSPTRSAQQVPPLGDLAGIGHLFEVTAVYSATGQPAQLALGKTFAITVAYTENERGPVIEDSLALYT